MHTARAFAAAALAGFAMSFGWQWFHPIFEGQLPLTLTGVGQAFRAINWLTVLICAGFFALAGAACGFFLTGGPSDGVKTFYTWDGLWDVLTGWWR